MYKPMSTDISTIFIRLWEIIVYEILKFSSKNGPDCKYNKSFICNTFLINGKIKFELKTNPNMKPRLLFEIFSRKQLKSKELIHSLSQIKLGLHKVSAWLIRK